MQLIQFILGFPEILRILQSKHQIVVLYYPDKLMTRNTKTQNVNTKRHTVAREHIG